MHKGYHSLETASGEMANSLDSVPSASLRPEREVKSWAREAKGPRWLDKEFQSWVGLVTQDFIYESSLKHLPDGPCLEGGAELSHEHQPDVLPSIPGSRLVRARRSSALATSKHRSAMYAARGLPGHPNCRDNLLPAAVSGTVPAGGARPGEAVRELRPRTRTAGS